jgi:hypothetical protein
MRRRIHAPYCVEGRLVCASLATISPAQDPYTVLYTRTGAQHSTLPTHTHTHTHTHTVLSLHIGFGGSTHILHTYYTYSSLGVQEGQPLCKEAERCSLSTRAPGETRALRVPMLMRRRIHATHAHEEQDTCNT